MVDQLVADADAAQNRRSFGEAEGLLAQALQREPDHLRAQLVLAMVEAKTGRATEAIARFHAVLNRDKGCFDAVFWLSVLYRNAGDSAESIRFAETAVRLKPDEAHAHSNLGLSLLGVHELERSIGCFERAAALNPAIAQNFHHLGLAYQLQGRDEDSIRAFRQAIAIAPNSMDTLFSLGQALSNISDNDGTIDCAQRILALNPKSAPAELLWASALIGQSKVADAEMHIDSAVALGSNDASTLAMLGLRYQALGRLEDANACFLKSAQVKPEQGLAYCAYARNHKMTSSDRRMVADMEALAQKGTIPARGLSFLHFGLGKAYEDLAEFERAMKHFDDANRIAYRLRYGNSAFDRSRYASVFDWTSQTFTRAFLDRYPNAGIESETPIFIVGMMRSGTTLVEQILSSHSEVNARGEQPFWMKCRNESIAVGEKELDSEWLKGLAADYLAMMKHIGPDARRLTDKMPDNFIVLGLLHLAFPNARFIHTMRDPIDTCLSIYTTPNRTSVEYACNRSNIVFAYQQYRQLMAHWQSVIPENRLFEVQYEKLISDREAVTREMVAFCGLDWDDACLYPEENLRSVATPSAWQVRQPVYTTSVERWRRFEPWLGAFAKLRAPQ